MLHLLIRMEKLLSWQSCPYGSNQIISIDEYQIESSQDGERCSENIKQRVITSQDEAGKDTSKYNATTAWYLPVDKIHKLHVH